MTLAPGLRLPWVGPWQGWVSCHWRSCWASRQLGLLLMNENPFASKGSKARVWNTAMMEPLASHGGAGVQRTPPPTTLKFPPTPHPTTKTGNGGGCASPPGTSAEASKLFLTEQRSKCFRLCRSHSLCPNYSTVQRKSSHHRDKGMLQ